MVERNPQRLNPIRFAATAAEAWFVYNATDPIRRRIIHRAEHKNDPRNLKLRDYYGIALAIPSALDLHKKLIQPLRAGDDKTLAEHAVDALQQGHTFSMRGRDVKVPNWAVAGGAAALAAGAVGALSYVEHNRQETALKEAPEEARIVRAIYDVEKGKQKDIQVNGQVVRVDGAQALAHEYAGKFLADMQKREGANGEAFSEQVDRATRVVRYAFDTLGAPDELRQAIKTVSGDAYEVLLLAKELPETAGVLTARKRDEFVALFDAIPGIVEAVSSLPVISAFPPVRNLRDVVRSLGKAQSFEAGGVKLDPISFVGAGSRETIAKVSALLGNEFSQVIDEEKGRDATAADIDAINAYLGQHATPVSGRNKAATMNLILASVAILEHPELAPQVAEVVGVLDAVQKDSKALSQELTNKLPSRRRARKS